MANFPPNPLHEHLQHLNALHRRSDAMPVFERKGDAQLAARNHPPEETRDVGVCLQVVAAWAVAVDVPPLVHEGAIPAIN